MTHSDGESPANPPAAPNDPLLRLRRPAAPEPPPADLASGPDPAAPAEPVAETPAEPVVETPPEPVVETPAEPVAATPVVETPSEPVVATPVVETPAEPVAATPVVETPSGPVAEIQPEPVAAVTARGGLRGMSRTAAVLTVLALVATALTAVAAATTVKFASDRSTAGASTTSGRAAIIAAAVSGVTATASYDYRTLDADARAAEAQLTEPLKSSYAQRFQVQIAPLARKYHATAKASVDPKFGAGLVSVTAGRANVLLFVDQVVTNNQLSAPRLDQTRVLATLARVGGNWRLSQLRTL